MVVKDLMISIQSPVAQLFLFALFLGQVFPSSKLLHIHKITAGALAIVFIFQIAEGKKRRTKTVSLGPAPFEEFFQ